MRTKENILEAARKLYNERGIASVTVRDIAAVLGISHGNLCYHYPNTAAITEALYGNLVAHFDQQVDAARLQAASPEQLFASTTMVASVMYEYRFFFLDFVQITRSNPKIRTHYRKLMERRRLEFAALFELLQQTGLIEKERFPGQYAHIIEMQFLVGDFWLSRAEIAGPKGKEKQLEYFRQVYFATISGLLTNKGIRLFLSMNEK